MRNVLLTAALAIAVSPAFALAPSGGEPNNTGCNGVGNSNSPCQPSNTNENTNGQSQTQGQGQAQGQIAVGGTGTGIGVGIGKGGEGGKGGSANASGGSATSGSSAGALSGSYSGLSDSGNSSSVAKGGSVGDTSSNASTGAVDASSGSVASSDGSGNSSTHVDASSSHNSQALFLPTLPGAAPTFVAGSSATVVASQCGPLMATESEDVNGIYLGLIRKHSIPLGRTDRIVPYEGGEYVSRSYPDGSTRLFGHRAVRTTAVLNVAGSRQVALGGGETGGNWGQGGAGGGSSMQRLVVQIDLEPCEAFHSVPAPVVVAVPAAVPTPAKPKRRSVRRQAICTPKPARPATTCPAS